MVLLIDNFDSFTYNLFQYVRKLGYDVLVKRHDEITVSDITVLSPSHIIVSPGPGNPSRAGISVELIRKFSGQIPILGVCLGHQSIGAAFGAEIGPAMDLYHGKSSDIFHDGKGIFSSMKNPFRAVRYHSLAIRRSSMPPELEISAWTDEGEIMGVRHKSFSVEGVQFHPESIGTESGLVLLENFLNPQPRRTFIQLAIRKASSHTDLDVAEAEKVMEEIASGNATGPQIASLLTALAVKGEAVTEMTGFARVMRRRATTVKKPVQRPVVDTCGTGGDAKGTFNISTCAAFIAAGAGVTVAKHGNRSVTSRCGSADLIEALGVNIAAPPEVMARALDEAGIAFLFAPKMHPSLKHAMPVRVDIGIRTVFNILGPLANPAAADRQMIGVFSMSIMERMSQTLLHLGTRRAMVVHGSDGLDEITLTGKTRISEIRDGWIREYDFDPRDIGYTYCQPRALSGGTLKANCETVLGILEGKTGPQRDVSVINAAAAIYLAGVADDMAAGARLAEESIDSGQARKKLEKLIAITGGGLA